ncbi:MAG TPA: DNA ligase D [Thermohalobaculum sp.]|nr:DNA ligase D [Thermohalobaculum sp.]
MNAGGTLGAYQARRDFGRTPEPVGAGEEAPDGWFVVQKHAATRLHYDFRLAVGGVLVSWAVTRGPSFDPRERRLAVRTEDHPLDYGSFEGTIPKGEYGGGTVMLWDRGAFGTEGDPAAGIARGELKMTLAGERLRGRFVLVRMKPKGRETRDPKGIAKQENWLLIKEKDDFVDPALEIGRWDRSVTTGRTMEEIAEGAKAAAPGSPPPFRAPMLATAFEEAPSGDDWLHETKFDGYRMLAAIDGRAVRCFTRNGHDWTARFRPVAEALAGLGLRSSLLDGEIVAAAGDGQADFSALQAALTTGGPIAYVIFDAPRLMGETIAGRPLRERKERLSRALPRLVAPLSLAEGIVGNGPEIAALACQRGGEGIVAKRLESAWRSGRSKSWLKIRCIRRRRFTVGGWSRSTAHGRPFASLLLGTPTDAGLVYAGRVGSGFDGDDLERIGALLERLERKTPPFVELPAEARRGARWASPALEAEVRFTEFTADGHLRHPVFERLTRTEAQPMPATDDAPAGVRLTNPERVLYPSMGATKRDLAGYFDRAWEAMQPWLDGRPVTLVRCPEGSGAECFFQKHPKKGEPEALGSVRIADSKGQKKSYVALPTRAALVSCAQIGALEIHLWGARADRIDRPDRLVIDLDPGEGVDWKTIVSIAPSLAQVLDEAGLKSFPLLTGGKGLHLHCPLERRQDWDVVSAFARGFAETIAELDPARFTASSRLKDRPGRIYLDWLRNKRGASAISPFSPRAREGAPIAVPVSWEELAKTGGATAYTITLGAEALAERAAAWGGPAPRQSVTRAGARRIGVKLDG